LLWWSTVFGWYLGNATWERSSISKDKYSLLYGTLTPPCSILVCIDTMSEVSLSSTCCTYGKDLAKAPVSTRSWYVDVVNQWYSRH